MIVEYYNDENDNQNICYLQTVILSKSELRKTKMALQEAQTKRHESFKTRKTEYIFDLYFTNIGILKNI